MTPLERIIPSLKRVVFLTALGLLPAVVPAQNNPPVKPASGDAPSRWDIFLGYSYLAPSGTVSTTDATGTPISASYDAVKAGALFSGSYFYNRFVGLQAEFGEHKGGDNDGFLTFGGGLIFRYPAGKITPFVHGLVDDAQTNGPISSTNVWGPALTAGGGLDLETPWHHLAIRIFQADYEYIHANWGPPPYGGRANIDSARLSAGIVFHAGSIGAPQAVSLSCPASPTEVYAGDAVNLTATANGLDPKAHVVYAWSGEGVTGSDSTAKVDTSALAPGHYTVTCMVKEGRPGKEGLKPWETATNTARFTVKPFEPPTLTCAANPASIKVGDTATITATGASPQNRPLTYSYSASAGTVEGSGPTATYASAGVQPGETTVTCNVSDDKGHAATATAMLTVVAPPPLEPTPEQKRLEARLALHSVFFPTAQPRAEHPEGGLVESQQATLTTLAADFKNYLAIKPDARLTLTGHADPRGSAEYNQALSDRRVNRVKQFLVEHGVPEASIDTRAVGKEQDLTADQVKELIEQNPELSDAQKAKVLHRLGVIVLAQNRRVDISLNTTGQQSEQIYPFNAADSATLLDEKAPAPKKRAVSKKK